MSEPFVGREAELATAMDTVATTTDAGGWVWDVTGVPGIGKSTFIDKLAVQVGSLGRGYLVLDLDLSGRGLDEAFRGDYGSDASTPVLWNALVRSRDLVQEWAERLLALDQSTGRSAESLRTFVGLASASLRSRIDECAHEHSLSPGSLGPMSLADQRVRATIRDLQQRLDEAFVEAWRGFVAQRRILITVRNIDGLVDDEIGHWLVRIALQLPRTMAVLSRVSPAIDLAPAGRRVHHLELPYLTLDQVDRYLRERFPEQVQPGTAAVIHQFTDGHAGGLDLAGQLLRENGAGPGIDPRELRLIFDRLPGEPTQLWGRLVHTIIEAIRTPLLREAVDAAAVVRCFDAPLLAALLTGDGTSPPDVGGVLDALIDLRLVRGVTDHDGVARHRLVEFVRSSLANHLRSTRQDRWVDLHHRAARYFHERLCSEEGDTAGGIYSGWYRYERPGWQADKRSWLEHSGQAPARAAQRRAQFSLVFLEAFWWWGSYHPFEFNERLIEDWERAVARWPAGGNPAVQAQDQLLATKLRYLLNQYPTGWVKPRDAPWDEMAAALRVVQQLCGLQAGIPDTQPEMHRRVRAMLRIFLAHTRRYRDPADPRASQYYVRALSDFTHLDDVWNIAWLLFESADLAYERGELAEAADLLGRAALRIIELSQPEPADDDEVVGDWDYELIANLHRIRADVHWASGDTDAAAAHHGQAVVNAYRALGYPQPPDAYTQRFYHEQITRTLDRLRTLAERDPAAAVAFQERVGAQVSAIAPVAGGPADGDPADGESLFPRAPRETEFGPQSLESEFYEQWLDRWEDRPDPAVALRQLAAASS